jgi:endonuclease YncB( thermonuclease family)
LHHRVVFAGFALLFGTVAQAEDLKCALAPVGVAQAPVQVRAVEDGRTVTLAGGRGLRLAGIETAGAGQAALEQLVLGRELALFKLGADSDRYGRIVAIAVAPPGAGIEKSVQWTLLAKGQARVSADIDDAGCAAALLGAENGARTAGLGVWAEPSYLVKNAGDFNGILADRGHFAVVEGKVLSVRESGGTIYVNFGRRWSEDFTVTVLKRNERIFARSGLDLKKLEGRNVRVRGTIEERGGPWIEAAHPGQIEIAEQK